MFIILHGKSVLVKSFYEKSGENQREDFLYFFSVRKISHKIRLCAHDKEKSA